MILVRLPVVHMSMNNFLYQCTPQLCSLVKPSHNFEFISNNILQLNLTDKIIGKQ